MADGDSWESRALVEADISDLGSYLENIVEDSTPQLGGDLDLNGKNIDFPTTANISDCLDEDDMASDSATKIATQQSIKAYADTKIPGDGTVNPTNLGNFDLWSAGTTSAPDGWSLSGGGATIAREGTIKKIGSYSAAITRNTSNPSLWQDCHTEKGIDYWKGRTVTLSCWSYATVANRLRIYIYDGITTTLSSYHTGDSTWQLLTVTKTISDSATRLTAYLLYITDGDTTCYSDGAMLVEGAMPYAFSPKPLPRGGTITAEVDETKFSHKIPIMINGTVYYIMLTQT